MYIFLQKIPARSDLNFISLTYMHEEKAQTASKTSA